MIGLRIRFWGCVLLVLSWSLDRHRSGMRWALQKEYEAIKARTFADIAVMEKKRGLR